MAYRFDAELWEYQGESPWVFVNLPADLADEIERSQVEHKPFGSIRVAVSTGRVVWQTSLFPDGGHGAYVLPVKKQVRVAAGIDVGDTATFDITLI